ncbi:hypothetical protein V6N13_001303 [Hibiscus sabdariffa]
MDASGAVVGITSTPSVPIDTKRRSNSTGDRSSSLNGGYDKSKSLTNFQSGKYVEAMMDDFKALGMMTKAV